jgi:rubredoxin
MTTALGGLDHGVQAGTNFEDLPSYWLCPAYGVDNNESEAAIEQML